MKEKIVIIFLGFLILGVSLIYFQKDGSDRQAIEQIFKAGISLDGNYFCQNIGKEEQIKVVKDAEEALSAVEKRKVVLSDCQEAFRVSKELQEKAGIKTTVLATEVKITEEKSGKIQFAASECSLFESEDKKEIVSGDIYKGLASMSPVTILRIESGKDVQKEVKENLQEGLKKENPRCA